MALPFLTNEINEDVFPVLGLLDLPEDALVRIASCLTCPRDAAALASSCSRTRRACSLASFRLRLASHHYSSSDDTTTSADAAAASPSEAQRRLLSVLEAICTAFPSTVELDLSSSPLGDEGAALAIERLPKLASLLLSGCKKITASTVHAAAQTSNITPSLRCLDMQRCFNLNSEALTELLIAASLPASKLEFIALSHIDLGGWQPINLPEPRSTLSLPRSCGGMLRLLALHNGVKITPDNLTAIAAACPDLEALCLGGSLLQLSAWEESAAAGAAAAAVNADAAPFVSELISLIGRAYDDGFRALLPRECLSAVTVELLGVACRLKRLQCLEVTFLAPGLAGLMDAVLNLLPTTSGGSAVPPLPNNHPYRLSAAQLRQLSVLDLCRHVSVKKALQWRSAARATGGERLEIVSAALSAAAKCSSASRVTPLHAASEDADTYRISELLSLGADVNARDRSGATPLFRACEVGHAAAAAALLAAGADVSIRNAAGEAPLYIAALRGHARAMEALLRHCKTAGIKWEDPILYDSGWTPLHAACVGGHAHIVCHLLSAAGQNAPALVRACNRYGQTSVHVAARKGSPALLRRLVDAGGVASVVAADCDGRTAADVAHSMGNASAWKFLTGGPYGRSFQQNHRAIASPAEKARHAHGAQPAQQRWVGRRLQQRKSTNADANA